MVAICWLSPSLFFSVLAHSLPFFLCGATRWVPAVGASWPALCVLLRGWLCPAARPVWPGSHQCRPARSRFCSCGRCGAVVMDACFLLLGEKGFMADGYSSPPRSINIQRQRNEQAGWQESASVQASKTAFQGTVSSCSPPRHCCNAQLAGRAGASHGGESREPTALPFKSWFCP